MLSNRYEKYCLPQMNMYHKKAFLVDYQGCTLTYGMLKESVDILSLELENKMSEGAVALIGKNCSCFYTAVLSCLKLNRAIFIFNSEWQYKQIFSNIGSLQITNLLRVDSNSEKSVEVFNFDKPSIEYTAGIYFATSGTTDQNKWVYHDLFDIFTNLKALAQTIGLTDKDRIHSILPLYTSNGMTITFLLPFCVGASIFLDQQFTPFIIGDYFRRSIENDVTILSLIPSVAAMLSKTINVSVAENLKKSKLRFAICGTAPLSEQIRERFEDKFNIPLYVNYGLTETLFISSQNDAFHTPESAGTIIPNMEVCFKEDEIGIKGISVFTGYINQSRIGDVFYTGDLGRYENGELYITGRKKDMIIKGGYNINPNQIDNYLTKLQEVKESYTFGVSNEIWGEELFTAIVLSNSTKDSLSEIRQRIMEHFPSYMIPKLFVIDKIPRNSSGKPVKRFLIQILKKE